jgi:hypothetical protein
MSITRRMLRALATAAVVATTVAWIAAEPATAKEPAFDTVDPAYAITNHVIEIPPGAVEYGIGPLGVAVDPTGAHDLFVGDLNGNVFRFPTTSGTPPFDATTDDGLAGPSRIGDTGGVGLYAFTFDSLGHLYATSSGGIVELDKTDAHVIRTITPEIGLCLGLAVHNDELFAQCGSLFRVGNLNGPGDAALIPNPAFPDTTPPIFSDTFGDGVTAAPDGTLYVATGGGVFEVQGPAGPAPGTHTSLSAPVDGEETTGFSPGSDGIAVGAENGHRFLIINNTDGTVRRFDFGTGGAPNSVATIAAGGTRGDFATVGPDGCMYLTQSTTVAKLTNADGTCDFSPTVPTALVTLTGDLDFGDVIVGTSATRSVTVTNTGTANLVFSEPAATQPVGNGFSVTGGTCSTATPVVPSGSCTVEVTFAPTVVGPAGANLELKDNAQEGVHRVNAVGNGILQPGTDVPEVPFATLLPASLAALAAGAILLRRRRRDGGSAVVG